jgi:hypothetical protein
MAAIFFDGRVDVVHRRHDLRDDEAATRRHFGGRRGELVRLPRRVGGLFDGAGQLL